MKALGKEFRFEPPLAIPGNGGTAQIEAPDCLLFSEGQPAFLQVSVFDGEPTKKLLARGLFEHVVGVPGLYRLIDGAACTGGPEKGIRIERKP